MISTRLLRVCDRTHLTTYKISAKISDFFAKTERRGKFDAEVGDLNQKPYGKFKIVLRKRAMTLLSW